MTTPAEPSQPESYDVVIVGGGPVGLAVALTLDRANVATVVIERQCFPIDKVCGEGIMPTGIEALRHLGIFDDVAEVMKRPFAGIKYVNEQGDAAVGSFGSKPGYGIRRLGLSQAFFKKAKAAEGVTLFEKTVLTHLERSEGGWSLTIRQKDEERKIHAKLLIGADGMRSKVRRVACLESEPPTPMKRYGARQHFNLEPWSDYVEVHWGRGIEAYVTPSADDRVEIAFLWQHVHRRELFGGKQGLTQFLDHFPLLRERILDASPINDLRGIGPLAVRSKSASDDGLLLLGDAYGYIDGITGEGISVGLEQAIAVGEMLPAVMASKGTSADALRPIGNRIEKLFRKSIPTTLLALFLTKHRLVRDMAIAGLRRSPRLFDAILEVNMGNRQMWAMPIFALCRAVWGAFWHALKTRQRALPERQADSSVDT